MHSSKKHIKTTLQCLDEGDFDRATKELKLIAAMPSADELRLFLEGLILLAENQRQGAAERFNALLLRLEGRTERSSVVEKYAVLLTLATYSMSVPNSANMLKAKERFLRSAELELFQQLVSNAVIAFDPEYHELQVTLQLVFGLSRAIGQGSISLIELLETNPILQVEQVHSGQSAVETFENLSGHEDALDVVARLGNCAMVRTLSYEYFRDTFGAVCSRSDGENRQKAIDYLNQMVDNVEPRRGNTHANVMLYNVLKPRLNELTLRHFINLGKVQEGFRWLESELAGKGMDFLRTETEHLETKEELDESNQAPDLSGALNADLDETRFVVQQKHFPGKRSIDEMAVFHSDVPTGETGYEVAKVIRVMSYNVSLDTYFRLLNDPIQIEQRVREEIIQKVCDNTNSIRRWALEEGEVEQICFPFQVGELFKERREFDDAIDLFRQSHAEPSQILKAIEQCQAERDGSISKDLEEDARSWFTGERKQLFPYSVIFKTEILVRNSVDREMMKARKSDKWLEGDNNPKLKKVKQKCQERKSRYKDDVLHKDGVGQSRLVDFSTLPELVTIIDENWEILKHLFNDKQQFIGLLVPLSQIRLNVDHSKLIDKTQFETARNLCLELSEVLDSR